MPLLFHGFAAPQALVLHTLRTFMATHVLEVGLPSSTVCLASMPLTNASNWTSPNGSDSYRQMPMTNGETTSKQPHTKLAKQMTVGMD